MTEETWAPPFPVNTQEVTIPTDGGVTLAATLYERPKKPVEPPAEGKRPKKIKEGDPEAAPRAWCLLVHGLLSDRNEFGPLAEQLAEDGFGVVAIDVRGHGKSGGPRGIYDVEKTAKDLDAVKAFVAAREDQWDLKPQQWAIIGHSTGAAVALAAGAHLGAGDLVVAAAPIRSFAEQMNPFKRLGYYLAYKMGGATNGDAAGPTVPYPVSYKDIFVDPRAMESARAKGFLQERIPLANYPYLMSVDGEALARAVADPTVLVMHGTRDQVISRRSAHGVYEAVASAKEWHEVEGCGHSMFLDGAAPATLKFLRGWLGYRLNSFNEVRSGHTKR